MTPNPLWTFSKNSSVLVTLVTPHKHIGSIYCDFLMPFVGVYLRPVGSKGPFYSPLSAAAHAELHKFACFPHGLLLLIFHLDLFFLNLCEKLLLTTSCKLRYTLLIVELYFSGRRIRGTAKSQNLIWLLHKIRTGNAGKGSCVKVSLLYYNLHQRQFLQQVIFYMTFE